eukprot:275778_1
MAAVVDNPTLKSLTDEDIQDYREAFNNFDKDGSGMISKMELATVMMSLGYSPTENQLTEMMNKVDLDGNGEIDFDEFISLMHKCDVESDFDREIREAFKFFDKNESGEIDAKELSVIMHGLGASLSDAEIELLIKEADEDGNGVISISEFLRFMYN